MIRPKYRFFHRIYLALEGLAVAVKREKHMRIHLIISILLLTPALFFPVTPTHFWMLLILLTFLIILELMNTAIETTIDLVTRRFSYRAKLAKDMASAAVLLNAILVGLFSIFIYGRGMYNFVIGVIVGH
ncbi:MAG: diacylglycerol kinase [Candidatus Margulisiibacteriota bacterium]